MLGRKLRQRLREWAEVVYLVFKEVTFELRL